MSTKEATVKQIETKDTWKMAVIHLETDGQPWKANAWKSGAYYAELKESAVVQIAVEQKPNHKDQNKMETWVATVNGIGDKAQRGPGGGGGWKGGNNQPKDEACVAAQVIVKEVGETLRANLALEPKLSIGDKVDALTMAFTRSFQASYNAAKEMTSGSGDPK